MSPRFFYHLYSHKIYFWLFFIAFLGQVFFWKYAEKIKAPFEPIPAAPTEAMIRSFSFGDNEFLFRVLATRFQNSGDVFAGFVSFEKYDYSRVYLWMKSLDSLNYESNLVPSLASYYYSQTKNEENSRYIINYLDEHASRDIDAKWWWMYQAVFLAKKNLHDQSKALELAYKLSKNNAKNAPIWTKQMPAFLHEENGEACLSFVIIQNLIQESESGVRQISAEEMNFMRYFIKNRLARLQEQKFDPRKCAQK